MDRTFPPPRLCARQFLHHIKLLRPDLYHGQPCLGGDPWQYLDFLNYYECIIPGRGSV